MTSSLSDALNQIGEHPNYKVLQRVPEQLDNKTPSEEKNFTAAIIDLETTGLSSASDEIIEIGTLIVAFNNTDGIHSVTFDDNQLQEPNQPISAEITEITGIKAFV